MRVLLMAATAATLIATSAEAFKTSWGDFSASTGFEYAAGGYGAATDTSILAVPFTVKFDSEKFALRATVPYVRIEGPGSVLGASESVIAIGPGVGPSIARDGVGDVVFAATYKLYPGPGSGLPFFEIAGKVKIPTADEAKGLGTGKTDGSLHLNAFKSFGPLTPFASVGYRFLGDPSGLDLRNGVVASAGFDFKVNPRVIVGATYDFRERATSAAEAASEISPYVTLAPAKGWSLNLYGVFGFSDGSADTGGGLQLRKKF